MTHKLRNPFIISLLIFMWAGMQNVFGQQVLLSQDVDTNAIVHKKWGPNDAHYFGYNLNLGLFIPAKDARMPLTNSWEAGVELYYKQKINGLLSVGLSLGYGSSTFRLKKDTGYSVPDSLFWHANVSHKKEKFSVYALTTRLFLRINFDPHRGDNLGKYLEIGAGPDVDFYRSYEALDINPDKIRVKTNFSHLPYFTNFPLYSYAMLKSGGLGVGLQYRLTAYTLDRYSLPDFPRYLIFLKIGK